MKVKKDSKGNIFWHCVGCGCGHRVTDSWVFNEDIEEPTITPSVLNTFPDQKNGPRCHCFITGGKIKFLNDCTHNLAGQTVEMVDCK